LDTSQSVHGSESSRGTPEAIAPLYWQLHTQRDAVEKVFFPEKAGELVPACSAVH